MTQELPATIEEYIARCKPEIQPVLQELRQTIKKAAPEAEEKISWGMATFAYYGNLVHFSAEKKHLGFYPGSSAVEAFQKDLTEYDCSKGTIRLPYQNPLPLDLINRIVLFRVKEQEALAKAKKEGVKTEKTLRPRYPMPGDVAAALEQENLTGPYQARPSYQQNDYIGWITRAKRPETREKRIRQMLDELHSGDAYMGMAYNAKK